MLCVEKSPCEPIKKRLRTPDSKSAQQSAKLTYVIERTVFEAVTFIAAVWTVADALPAVPMQWRLCPEGAFYLTTYGPHEHAPRKAVLHAEASR
jgi:hypothetical protein